MKIASSFPVNNSKIQATSTAPSPASWRCRLLALSARLWDRNGPLEIELLETGAGDQGAAEAEPCQQSPRSQSLHSRRFLENLGGFALVAKGPVWWFFQNQEATPRDEWRAIAYDPSRALWEWTPASRH